MDVNGDGRMDFITGGWFGDALRWRENPGDPDAEWPEHEIAVMSNIETTRLWDVDGDGSSRWCRTRPTGRWWCTNWSPTRAARMGRFDAYTIYAGNQGHGLGFGDVNGDGRCDFVLKHGLAGGARRPLERRMGLPPGVRSGVRQRAGAGRGCQRRRAERPDRWSGAPLRARLVGTTHRPDGAPSWFRHPIDPYKSQYHDLQWADIDGDGAPELITGQRYRAHNGRDPARWRTSVSTTSSGTASHSRKK